VPRRTWTDQQLADAISMSATWTEVLRTLGLTTSGGSRAAAERRAAELGLDVHHLPGRGATRPRTRWTDEELREAVRGARNLRQVFLTLGLAVGGGAWVRMREHIARLDLDTSHWDRPVEGRSSDPPATWTDAEVRRAFAGAASLAEVMRRLGLDPGGKRARGDLERRLVQLGLDASELAGQAWRRGRHDAPGGRRARPLTEILVADSSYGSTSHLKRRLIEEGVLARRCERCEITTWLGRPAPLQLDHRNGDRTDNRVRNLRLLCANCHALTDTYCGRNIGRR
jgi:hypothetical protein